MHPYGASQTAALPKRLAVCHSRRLRVSNATGASEMFKGNHRPVMREMVSQECKVQGKLPDGLRGAYLRNGPNPPQGAGASGYWFEGDGMVHSVRFGDGKVWYSNHFVRTLRYTQESQAQRPIFLRVDEMRGVPGLIKVVGAMLASKMGSQDRTQGHPANTAIIYHAGRLFALQESDVPYLLGVDPVSGSVSTQGRWDWGGRLDHPFTAHPKVDPDTGVMHFYGYNLASPDAAAITYGAVSPRGQLVKRVDVALPARPLPHDFAITANAALLIMSPLEFDLKEMVFGGRLPFRYDHGRDARIGVLPFRAESSRDMTWHDVACGVMSHAINAWEEEDGTIKLLGIFADHNVIDLDWVGVKFPDTLRPRVRLVTLPPPASGGRPVVKEISSVVGDLPTCHPAFTGRHSRFTWFATLDTSAVLPLFDGVAKVDVTAQGDALVASFKYGPHCYGGEPLFVPRIQLGVAPEDEDNGWLLCHVHNQATGVSTVNIYDARGMSAEPLACVVMPQRVPYGFHGSFLHERQLRQMQCTQERDSGTATAACRLSSSMLRSLREGEGLAADL